MDLDRMKHVADTFNSATIDVQTRYIHAAQIVLDHLDKSLPALSEMDRAAAAWVVAEVLTAMRDLPLSEVGDVVTETAIGYSIGACKLLGMVK